MNIQIKPFTIEYTKQCSNLLQYLWKQNSEERLKHFYWGYINNPNCKEKPLAVIALDDDNNVLGFRGYHILSYKINNIDQRVAYIADTVVSPLARRQGVFKRMTEYSFGYLRENGINLISDLGPSWPPYYGYKKLGFIDLSKFRSVYRWGFISLFQKKVLKKERKSTNVNYTKSYKGNTFHVVSILSENIINKLNLDIETGKIQSVRDNDNILWKSLHPDSDYVYAFSLDCNNNINAFFWFRTGDFYLYHLGLFLNENKNVSKRLLDFFYDKLKPSAITAWSFALKDDDLSMLNFCGLHKIPFINKFRNNPPVIVRSLIEDSEGKINWIINGLDVRDVDNWRIDKFDGDSF